MHFAGSNAEGDSVSVFADSFTSFVICSSLDQSTGSCSFDALNVISGVPFSIVIPSNPSVALSQGYLHADLEYSPTISPEITFSVPRNQNPAVPAAVIVPLLAVFTVGPATEFCADGIGVPPTCGVPFVNLCGTSFNSCEISIPITIAPAAVPEPSTPLLFTAGLLYLLPKMKVGHRYRLVRDGIAPNVANWLKKRPA